MPITVRWPSRCNSTTTMQLRRVTGLGVRPNFTARSTTGTTLPRRLITPRMKRGALGTVVTVSYSMISFACRIPTPYSSSPTQNVRYWVCSGSAAVVVMSAPLKPCEVGGVALDQRGRDPVRAVAVAAVPVPGFLLRDGGRHVRLDDCVMLRRVGDAEEGDELLQRFGLRRQLLRRARQLFGRRRGPLRHLVHLRHRLVDLIHTARLLA